jgi:mono/diheme cytochrome c family protein
VARLLALGLLALLVVAGGAVWYTNFANSTVMRDSPPAASVDPKVIARGAYLAKLGNCAGCHTGKGGQDYAGGDPIATPFGTIYAGNLTSDKAQGIGTWSSDQFWRAVHEGRSKDGRLLLPAFPYSSYTTVTREDADAMFAFFQALPASAAKNRVQDLHPIINNQAAVAIWRTLHFRPETFRSEPTQSASWNRGAYLVTGLGHCAQCHGTRNLLGGIRDGLALNGGKIPGHAWYAPSLLDQSEAAVTGWGKDEVIRLLRSGMNERASTIGPMAQVVSNSLQHANDDDLNAMATYLLALKPVPSSGARAATTKAIASERGAGVYKENCAQCHGELGKGGFSPSGKQLYPALAGNRAVTLPNADNLVQIILNGGYLPAAALNPQPFGMPPFSHQLSDEQIAQLANFLRASWGNSASHVEVSGVREGRNKSQLTRH